MKAILDGASAPTTEDFRHLRPTLRALLFGAGGHAKVTLDCMIECATASPVLIVDSDPDKWGTELWGTPIIGEENLAAVVIEHSIQSFIVAVGTVGDFTNRVRLYELGLSLGLEPLTVKHPKSVVSRWAKIGLGTVIAPAAVVNADALIGVNVIVNTNAVVEHDCVVGDHSHIATAAILAGNVNVGPRVMIGAGAVIRQGLTVGAASVVGAGAVVTQHVPPGDVVIGSPARKMTPSEEQ